MKQIFAVLLLILVVVAFSSCNKDDNGLEKMRESELAILDEYIANTHPDSLPKSSGLYYIEEIEGHGDSLIRGGDNIQIFYATWRLDSPTDSTLIDQSQGYLEGQRYEPKTFVVGTSAVISGLDEAVTYMREGGKAHLVLPSEIAYGQQGSGAVGGFTTLLMEVEVYKVYPFIVPEEEQ
jgi:FKBP-type peptidyl-prolyl cis-trans isomerase FkpA